jgi:hypothetical protein
MEKENRKSEIKPIRAVFFMMSPFQGMEFVKESSNLPTKKFLRSKETSFFRYHPLRKPIWLASRIRSCIQFLISSIPCSPIPVFRVRRFSASYTVLKP